MRLAAIQHDIVWEDAEATCAHVAPMIADAAARQARLIVLPEMFATGFSMHPERTAEPEGGFTEQFLREQASMHGAYLLGTIAQQGADGNYRNNAVLAAPDGTVHRYAKIHPFTYSGEHEHYAAGDRHLTVEVDGLRVTVFICYDLRFADEFWARAPETDLYLLPSNWPERRRDHWRALLPARAIENQAYVLGVNRVGIAGTVKHLDYVGDSALIDPMGHTVFEGGPEEAVLVADVEADAVSRARRDFPFLADRR
ncbi:MAG: nitrilase-related carbon-nitrogen hydrolase [Jatrophihabitantaceae bacterium]